MTETVERGRVSNATEEIVDDYFAVLEETLKSNNLDQIPQLIYNCDEAAVYLNKSSQKVVVPRNSKHCHSLAQGTSEHISVLCCANATGAALPPLIVFAKGFPSLRVFQNDGCANVTYSTSDSGFVNRDIYMLPGSRQPSSRMHHPIDLYYPYKTEQLHTSVQNLFRPHRQRHHYTVSAFETYTNSTTARRRHFPKDEERN